MAKKQYSAEQRLLAKHIVRMLNAAQKGLSEDPRTWIDIAQARGITLMSHRILQKTQGQYLRPVSNDGSAIIEWCTARSPHSQARALFHELGHDVLRTETTREIFDENFLYGFDGDSDKFSESVARIAEEMKFGKRRQ